MTTKMQELILFGSLAKMQTLKPIDDGALKTLVNTAPSIGNQFIEIVPKKINQVQAFNQNTYSEYTSYTWNKCIDENENIRYRPIEFDSYKFIGSFIWQTELIKKTGISFYLYLVQTAR